VFAALDHRRVAVIGAGRDRSVAGSPPVGSEVACVITAGALHSVSAWRHVGGFRDDFFIDYVDIEFCFAARARGYVVAQAHAPTILHSIGQPTHRRLVFRTVSPSHHDRTRRYFMTRNRIVVWRRYLVQERRWIASDFVAGVKELIKIALFETDRAGKLRAIARGARDGMRAGATRKGQRTR
jgi:rhamnosyltransferase